MKQIVLDTNIIYQQGLNSGLMKILEKLVSEKLVTVHVPEIVKREFITKRVSELINSFNNVESSFTTIMRKVENDGPFKKQSASLQQLVLELKEGIEKQVTDDFDTWLDMVSANILVFSPAKISNVLDDYFTGKGAFKKQKSREDFPDSMILHSICSLVDEVGEVYVVLSDGAFKKGIKEYKSITSLNSLNDVFNLHDVKEFLFNEQLSDYFIGSEFSENLTTYFRKEEDLIHQIYIEDCVTNTEILGDNIYSTELNFPDSKSIKDLSISNFYQISEMEYTADITFTANATLHYITGYGSYLNMQKDTSRDIDIDSMNGDGMCDLYEYGLVKYSGNVNLSFSDKQTLDTIASSMSALVQDNSLIDITLEIDDASLISVKSH